GGDEGVFGDVVLGVERLVIDGLLQVAQIDPGHPLGRKRVKAALGHAHVERHLAAFEAMDGDAAAGLLPFHAASSGLALARADAARNAHQLFGGAWIVGQLVQFHLKVLRRPKGPSYFTISTRCWTLRIMPCTAGVSSSSTIWLACFRPRPINVA